jgi:hypothetical protein
VATTERCATQPTAPLTREYIHREWQCDERISALQKSHVAWLIIYAGRERAAGSKVFTHHAAPITENEIAIEIPSVPHMYGDVSVKNLLGI